MDVVHLPLKPLALALEPIAFSPDLLQSATTFLEVRGSLGLRGYWQDGEDREPAN
jgi:hypothetical protein